MGSVEIGRLGGWDVGAGAGAGLGHRVGGRVDGLDDLGLGFEDMRTEIMGL